MLLSRELGRFFLLAYALTWIFTIPFVVLWNTAWEQTLSPIVLFFLPAPFGPTFAALILTARSGGRPAVKELLRKLLMWRASPSWWLFALLAPVAVVAAAIGVSGFRGAFSEIDVLAGFAVAPVVLLGALPFGPLPEELGWRGFAQPRLLESGGVWKASLVIGVAWTFWHTPMFWFPGAAIPSFLDVTPLSILLYLAQITAEACLMTALYLATRGSVLLAVVYHTTFNTAETIVFRMLPDPNLEQQVQVYVISIVLSWLLAIALLARARRRYDQ